MDIVKTKQNRKDLRVYIITHSSDISAEDYSGVYKTRKGDYFSDIIEGE
jgi:hypothetical protein